MNKELFVSSTPHETKVGLVEDDLLAEIYMERENEYTLAGSIYKGRVTRVLPGMQSAFVDIGLERDAFLYVSDFMELEEHDDDLTDVVPANRGVQDMRQDVRQDMRPQAVPTESAPGALEADASGPEAISQVDADEGSFEADNLGDNSSSASTDSVAEPGNSADSQNRDRDRGGFRGRRRRRGGRRDGRERSQDRGSDRGPDRGPERSPDRAAERTSERGSERFARPAAEGAPPRQDFTRTQPSGPPPGYTPILLPGESISKYQRYAQQPPAPQPPVQFAVSEIAEEAPADLATPVAATFPEDEPIFAATDSVAEPLHEEHEDIRPVQEEPAESASTSTDWNQEFRRPEEATIPALGWPGEQLAAIEQDEVHEGEVESDNVSPEPAHSPVTSREEQAPVFAAPGTLEEETIDEEEADAVHYESSSDEGYEEFEEETQAGPGHLNGDAPRPSLKSTWHPSPSPARFPPSKPLILKARKTAKNSNSRRHRPRRKPCSTPKPAAMAPSMPASKFALPPRPPATRSVPSARVPDTTVLDTSVAVAEIVDVVEEAAAASVVANPRPSP